MPQARISVASGREEEERDLRAASCPASSSPKGVPYSSVLAERREIAAKLAAAKAGKSTSRGPKREHGWSSTSADDTASRGTKSSAGSTSGKERSMSPRALMRKYRAKVKPRTYLYTVFGLVCSSNNTSTQSNLLRTTMLLSTDCCCPHLLFILKLQIELFGIAIFCASAAAGSKAVYGNYASRAQDGIGAVHEVSFCLQCCSDRRRLSVQSAHHFYTLCCCYYCCCCCCYAGVCKEA
jgi:hypothetical protein